MSQAAEASRRRWVEIIGRQRASGIEVGRFCRREGLAPSTFFAWRRRLGDGRGLEDSCGAVRREDSNGAAFVEVVAAGESAAGRGDGVTASGVEICLGNGRRIGVARSFDPQTLRRVLAVLEQMPAMALPSAEHGTVLA